MEYNELTMEEEALRRQVHVVDGHIVINVAYEYQIATSRCDTPEKLLYWIWHLCEKTWMTLPVMERFIKVACRESNIKMQDA